MPFSLDFEQVYTNPIYVTYIIFHDTLKVVGIEYQFTSFCLSVLVGLKCAAMSCFWKILLSITDTPDSIGLQKPKSSCSQRSGLGCGCAYCWALLPSNSVQGGKMCK